MPKDKLGWIVGVYRVSILSVVGFMAWMQTNYTRKEKFDDYVKGHEVYSQTVLTGLREDLSDIKISVRRIEDRLDKQRTGLFQTNTTFLRDYFYGRR